MKPIYTLDIETDPFKHGRRPVAFAIGFYDGEKYVHFWGKKCIQEMFEYLQTREEGIIYAHNGGRFDVLGYLMKWIINRSMRIINSRIILAEMECGHELRDSYAIMPFPLGAYKGKTQKKEIEIKKLEKKVREKNKAEIVEYLGYDCKSLWELCSEFVDRYGPALTIGTTSMRELKKIHTFELLSPDEDMDLRSQYFYGGRTEYFEKGILWGDFKVYDVNSMYPHVMRSMMHPIGKPSMEGTRIGKNTCFITALGINKGAFPQRMKDGGISFLETEGEFSVTRHEWDMALKYNLFQPTKVLRTVDFDEQGTFAEFVDKFYNERLEARAAGDEITALFLKFILNSAYGKFAQSRENYREYIITDQTMNPGNGWIPDTLMNFEVLPEDNYIVWSKPSKDVSCFNVATGASITGGARSVLMEALAVCERPIYCDTDSVVCESLPLQLDENSLGAWKLETSFDLAAVGRKKLYAFFLTDKDKVKEFLAKNPKKKKEKDGSVCVKQANKGVSITPAEIMRVCKGEIVNTKRDAPSFKLDGRHEFIQRRVRMAGMEMPK